MIRFWLLLAVTYCYIGYIRAQDYDYENDYVKNYVTVSGADTLIENSKYRIAVTLHGTQPSADYVVGIRSTDGIEVYSKNVTVKLEKTKFVKICLGQLTKSSYKLFSQAFGSSYVVESVLLKSVNKQATFIQTDKATYKPSDKVVFRVIVLNQNLKALKTISPLQIYINDNNSNRIKQFDNVTLTTGVYRGEVQLSDYPPLGTWYIYVNDGSTVVSKSFVVEEYVLPKFSLSLTSKRNIAISDSTIAVTLSGIYAFGQDVKGHYDIIATRTTSIGATTGQQMVARYNIEINGKDTQTFNLYPELGVSNDADVIFKVIFREDLTGAEAATSVTVSVRNVNYQLVLSARTEYKPNMGYVAYAKVTDFDGIPIRDTVNNVTFRIEDRGSYVCPSGRVCYWTDPVYKIIKEAQLNSNGIAEVKFETPSTYYYLYLRGIYRSAPMQTLNIKRGYTYSFDHIQATVQSINPSLNSPFDVLIESSVSIPYVSWQITAGNNILQAKTVHLESPSTNFLISITPTNDFAPTARLVVYYVNMQSSYIISDNVNITFSTSSSVLPNQITLGISTNQTEPGKNVTIDVNASPKAYVGLLGVDQKVLNLRGGNDFSATTIANYFSSVDNPNTKSVYSDRNPSFSYARTVVLISDPNIMSQEEYENSLEPQPEPEPVDEPAGPRPSEPEPEPQPEQETETEADPNATPPKTIAVRTLLPETWFIEDIENIGCSGHKSIIKKVPDEITTWIITGFALDYKRGFGLTAQPSSLLSFYQFFIQTSLPYQIVRGETVAISLTVFNYQNEDVVATVVMDNSRGEFDFVTPDGSSPSSLTKTISINSNDGKATSFLIRPLISGYITIKFSAYTNNAGDGIQQQLLVVPEGVEQSICNSALVDLRTEDTFEANYPIDIPASAVSNSSRFTISAVGEILGKVINNLDKLIKIPYGCGEQNMINFVPNIVVVNYLTATNQLTANIRSTAYNYMEQGYQRELTYRRTDGSFSIWGTSDSYGSTWLTAYVAKSFRQAQAFITIDENVITKALQFIVNKQQADGSFLELSPVHDKSMQGGGSSALALDAFVTTAFLQKSSDITTYSSTITRSLNHITSNILGGNNDLYTLAVASYCLQIAGDSNKDAILQLLQDRATVVDGFVYWLKTPESTSNLWYVPNSLNVEITAYALMAYLEAGLVIEAMPIVKWIVSQQNPNGGFQSTQDTVVGITALAKYAEKIASSSLINQQVDVSYNNQLTQFILTRDNVQVLQQKDIADVPESVNLKATGSGVSVFQLCYFYNMIEIPPAPRFTIDVEVTPLLSNYLTLHICTAYIPDDDDLKSNMAVMEITLPSGYTIELSDVTSLVGSNHVSRVETKNANTVVVIYFAYLDANPTCVKINYVTQSTVVADAKPTPITVIDYYDSSKRAVTFFANANVNVCDICEIEDCPVDCPSQSEPEAEATLEP